MLAPVNWGGNAACPPSVFRRYLLANLERGLGEIDPKGLRSGPLYIVASGPSLEDTWLELIERPGEIWALNAAFDWLCRKGIRPDYGVVLAPEDGILNYFQEVERGDKFLCGSMTHPKLIDRMIDRGGGVKLWHVASPGEWDLPIPKTNVIYGAGTIGSRAIDLAWVMGFRDVHILGMDACISLDGRVAVDRPLDDSLRALIRTFMVGGRAFVAMPSHARQVEDFASVIRPLKDLEVTLYGDGMLQWSQMREHE